MGRPSSRPGRSRCSAGRSWKAPVADVPPGGAGAAGLAVGVELELSRQTEVFDLLPVAQQLEPAAEVVPAHRDAARPGDGDDVGGEAGAAGDASPPRRAPAAGPGWPPPRRRRTGRRRRGRRPASAPGRRCESRRPPPPCPARRHGRRPAAPAGSSRGRRACAARATGTSASDRGARRWPSARRPGWRPSWGTPPARRNRPSLISSASRNCGLGDALGGQHQLAHAVPVAEVPGQLAVVAVGVADDDGFGRPSARSCATSSQATRPRLGPMTNQDADFQRTSEEVLRLGRIMVRSSSRGPTWVMRSVVSGPMMMAGSAASSSLRRLHRLGGVAAGVPGQHAAAACPRRRRPGWPLRSP